MGSAATLLEGLCGHALSFGAQGLDVERKDGREWVSMRKGGSGISVANYDGSSADAPTLRLSSAKADRNFSLACFQARQSWEQQHPPQPKTPDPVWARFVSRWIKPCAGK